MSTSQKYTVFVRNWWKIVNGKKVPNQGARKTVLRVGLTREEAYNFCQHYNDNNDPGPLSRKAEFTAE